jgi:DNA-binding MurR/RpiR family transcriptional regulator
MSNEELFDKLKRLYPDFSKGHKKIADVIFESWESIAFISPREIGERLGVSETTVIRFAKELGYNSYSEFREYVRGLIKLKLTPAEKMISSIQKLQKSHEGFLNKVFAEEMENFKNGITKVSSQDFFKAVELIENAKRVFIIGFGVSASLCYFLEFRFQRMQIDTHILTHGDKYFCYWRSRMMSSSELAFSGVPKKSCMRSILPESRKLIR